MTPEQLAEALASVLQPLLARVTALERQQKDADAARYVDAISLHERIAVLENRAGVKPPAIAVPQGTRVTDGAS